MKLCLKGELELLKNCFPSLNSKILCEEKAEGKGKRREGIRATGVGALTIEGLE